MNLITDTRVKEVSAPDNGFFQQALEQTREVITGEIEKVHADGAYNSAENREYCQSDESGIDMVITAIQGAMPRYDIRLDEHDDSNLIVKDNKTGELVQSYPVKPRGDKTKRKWSIKTGERKYRYFDEDNLRVADLRRKLKDIPPGESCLRNNVEATIFQLGYHYPDDKSRYRTLAKHKLWAYSRSLWINFVRIVNYTTRTCQRALSGQKTPRYISNLCFNMHIIVNKFIFNKNNQNCPAKSLFSAI
ncbi:hypothetical protein [Petrimonas mucosa]|uniref:hypothetical protein n=1 Tax=Petrimonas mucosa TaxID=1642646 RepID=UPI003BD2FAFB